MQCQSSGWRLWCGEVLPTRQVPGRLEHQQLYIDDRSGCEDEGGHHQGQEGEDPGLGHWRTAAVQTHPGQLLQGRTRSHHRLRYHQQDEFQEHQAVAGGGGGVRPGLQPAPGPGW